MTWPLSVTRADLRIDTFRSGGAGGQNVNKVNSACRITHLPTGLTGVCRNHRDQPQNKAEAFRRLAAQLVPLMRAAATGDVPEGTSSARVRSYDLDLDRVVDHRLGKTEQLSAADVLDASSLWELQTSVLLSLEEE